MEYKFNKKKILNYIGKNKIDLNSERNNLFF